VELGVGLQQRRAVRVAAGQWPGAEVQAQLDDPAALVAVGHERDGEAGAPAVAVEVQDDLFDPAGIGDAEVDVLDVDVARRQPRGHVGDEAPERALAPDPPADRMMHLGQARERFDERVDLPGHQAVEEGHRSEALAAVLLEHALQRGGGEELGRPGHATSIPCRAGGPSARYDLTGGGDWA
jgi:hypothetical protein